MSLPIDSKILVTGFKGQLGFDCVKELKSRGFTNVLGIDKDELDITKEEDVKNFFNNFKPDVIIHCAAYTAVDKAEENRDLCFAINVNGTKYLADGAKLHNSKFVYISTDYVFNGKKNSLIEVDDKKDPINYYGFTKSEGEDIVKNTCSKYFIIRTMWAIGTNGNNFVKTMLKLVNELKKTDINVVNDQIGSPTFTFDLANLIADMIQTDKYGIYHATNEGYLSWYEFAKEIFELSNLKVNVNPVPTEMYTKLNPTSTKRPLNSKLDKLSLTKNGFKLLPNYKDSLIKYLEMIK